MTVTLEAVYAEGAALDGAPPLRYRVTAQGGALVAECADHAEALGYFLRWAGQDDNRVCAWCGLDLGYSADLPVGAISHGICEACAAKLDAEE